MLMSKEGLVVLLTFYLLTGRDIYDDLYISLESQRSYHLSRLGVAIKPGRSEEPLGTVLLHSQWSFWCLEAIGQDVLNA